MTGIQSASFAMFLIIVLWLGVPAKAANYIMVAVDSASGLDGGMYIYPGDGDSINATTPSPGLTTVGMPSIDINSIDVNIADDTTYFLDRITQCIYRFRIDTHTVTIVRCGVSRSVYSTIAYDWISGNMYWTDGFFNWIAVQPVDTADMSMYRVIIQNDIEKPRALAVDPIAGLIFWFDINPSGHRIGRASLDGSDRTLVISRSLLSVHDLETDPISLRIYWTDARKYTIESSNYDGSDRRIVYKRISTLFRSISIDTNYVCATIFDEQSWRCIHKSTGDVKLTRFSEFSTSNPKLIAVYKQDMQPAITDNCPLMGCEHFCVRLPAISKCMCKEGYTLDTAGVHCNVNNHLYGKGVLICNATHICMFDFRAAADHTEPLICLSNMVQDCRHLAVDTSTGIIFYADSVANTINGYDITTNVIGSLTSASDVSGLTFDWTDDLLYWSEATSGQVKALSLTNNAVTVISQATSPPSMVTVDPHSRSLFWVEETGGFTGRIMFKSLNGNSSVQVLKQFSPSSISSLFHDITSDRLFYVDNNTLYTTTRNGSYSTFFPFDMTDVTHIVIYKRYILWSDGSGYLKSIPTQFFQQQLTSLPITFGSVTGMAVYDSALQLPVIGLCRYMNGGCEHMCFTEPTGGVICACRYGFVLQPDQKSCSSVYQQDNFILAPDFANGVIYQVSTDDASINALDMSMTQRPWSAIYEHTSAYVYWADITDGQIIRGAIDGTNEQVVFTSEVADSYPTNLDLDSSTGNVYASITGSDNTTIAGSMIVLQPSTRLFKTIVADLQTVNGLALFPSKGIMFYVNRNDSAYFIVRASMDGTNPRAIVILPNDGYRILTIDYINEKLYWSGKQGVSYSDLNGQNQSVLFNDVKEILSIQIIGNYLFYTSHTLHKIVKYDLLTGSEVPFMPDNADIGIVYNTFIHPRPVQSETSECSANNGGCSTFCLPREVNTVLPCACPDGINPKPGDPNLCEGDILCEDGITNGIFSSACRHLVQEACTFLCQPGYISTIPTSTLTCESDGQWSTDPQTVCENKCPASTASDHWQLWTSCQRAINDTCQYDCSTGYTKSFDVITCNEGNVWSHSLTQLCVIDEGTLQKSLTAEAEDTNVAYFGVAGIAGLLLLIFLVIILVCLVKRRRFRKQLNTRQSSNGTTSTNTTEVSEQDMAESSMFNDMYNFQTGSPLPPKATAYPRSHTWDTLCDAIPLDFQGESSDFDFGTAASCEEQNTNQPFSLVRQTPPAFPDMNMIGHNPSQNSPKGARNMRRVASESAMHSSKEETDTFINSPLGHADMPTNKQEANVRRPPSSGKIQNTNAKPPMRRIASAFAMKVPTEETKPAEKPPMRRTTSVASMQTVHEEPTMRRTNSALFTKSSVGASSRRRSSVVSSLGDQLNSRRSSVASLETQSRRNSQKRRASVACIPSQTNEHSNSRRSSSSSIQNSFGDRLNRRRSSVVSVKLAFGESENSRRSSISQVSDESNERRPSIAPVETVEVEEEDVFDA